MKKKKQYEIWPNGNYHRTCKTLQEAEGYAYQLTTQKWTTNEGKDYKNKGDMIREHILIQKIQILIGSNI